MTFCFRARFKLAESSGLQCPNLTWQMPGDGAVVHMVEMAAWRQGETIADARQLVLRGCGYDSERAAMDEGERWVSWVQAAFAAVGLGADFGARAARGFVTDYGLERAAAVARTLNDVHGVMAFECDPKPTFVSVSVRGARVLASHDRLAAALELAVDGPGLGRREQVAYDLFAASMSQPSVDARFAMLMMASESLIEQRERSLEVQVLVDELVARVVESDLPGDEIESINGALRWLKDESIGQAGRRLVGALAPRTYGGQPPTAFFGACYRVRSALMHGHDPLPSRSEVGLGEFKG